MHSPEFKVTYTCLNDIVRTVTFLSIFFLIATSVYSQDHPKLPITGEWLNSIRCERPTGMGVTPILNLD